MHRFIPSRFSDSGTVLEDISDDAAMLADIMLLDGATNDRLQGENAGLSGISPYELVYGIPNAHILRAAFLHTSGFGSRFNDSTRGCWYAAAELQTSIDEVAYHKAKRLAEIVVPEMPFAMPGQESSDYDDWQADFHAAFHSLEPAEAYSACLQPEPVPECYEASQQLARSLLQHRSNGILYPSVRHRGGLCLACFRPALVYNPRQDARYRLTFTLVDNAYALQVSPRTLN
jgi:RES domain-containing protein